MPPREVPVYCEWSSGLGGGQGEYCWRTDITDYEGRLFCPKHAPAIPREATMSITEFLSDRLTDDERENRPDVDPESWCDRVAGIHYEHDRIAAEITAKRAIISAHSPHKVTYKVAKASLPPHAERPRGWQMEDSNFEVSGVGEACNTCDCEHGDDYPCETIRALAAIYSHHPDYRSEWE
jgi:hypothetical protein